MMEEKVYTSGKRSFGNKDFYLESEVILDSNMANCYVVMGNHEEIFGLSVEDNDCLNIYADYDMAAKDVSEDLIIIWVKDEAEDSQLHYRMNKDEKECMKKAVEEYLYKQGIELLNPVSFTVSYVQQKGMVFIGSENSSGCKYEKVYTVKDLKDCLDTFIDQYVKYRYRR